VLIKHCIPRPDKRVDRQQDERPRTPWTLAVSQFKDYRIETPNIINDCFELDWSSIKKPKFKSPDEDAIKEKCRMIYPCVREIYRRLSCQAVAGIIFAVGWNTFREFMISSICVQDNNCLKPEDIDRLFIAVNAGQQKKSPYNPDKLLVRYEFLEIMLRTALKKYIEPGFLDNEADAVENFWNEYLNVHYAETNLEKPYFYSQHKWRLDRYWNEPCDNIFKAYAPLFNFLFNQYGGIVKKPGQKITVTLDEYEKFITDSGIINDSFNTREIPICFSMALQLHVNEVDSDKHINAFYLEFLEMVARACEEASIASSPHAHEKAAEDEDAEDAKKHHEEDEHMMSLEERQSLPLHVKIENAIPYFL
jgi:hypothetical protein